MPTFNSEDDIEQAILQKLEGGTLRVRRGAVRPVTRSVGNWR